MRFNLARLAKRNGIRRKVVTFRPITIPGTYAADLFAIYRPALDVWTEAAPAILAAYERTLAEMMTDSPEDVGATISDIERRIDAAMMTIRLRLTRWAARVEAAHRAKWRATVLAGAKVDIGTMIGPEDARLTVGAAIERNVALIKSVSDQARTRIADAVFRGFRERAAPTEIAREIREAVGMQRKRALRIAAHQNSALGAALNEERNRQAGVNEYQWVHSAKLHPRLEHLARDGKIFEWDNPPADGPPGTLPNCGCTSRAHLDIDAMIAKELAEAA